MMKKSIRKAFVAVAVLLALSAVPVASQASDQAGWRGGYGDWPVSSRIGDL
jgi:ABC-type sugar transport system substrate-binding protein